MAQFLSFVYDDSEGVERRFPYQMSDVEFIRKYGIHDYFNNKTIYHFPFAVGNLDSNLSTSSYTCYLKFRFWTFYSSGMHSIDNSYACRVIGGMVGVTIILHLF